MMGPLEELAQKGGAWQELSEDSPRGLAPARVHGPPEPRACVPPLESQPPRGAGKGAAPSSIMFLIHTLEMDPALQVFEIAPRNVAFLTAEPVLTTFGVPHPSFHHHFAGPPLAHLPCFLSHVGQPFF